MQEDYLRLFQALVSALGNILGSPAHETERMERCFHCCESHWWSLRDKIKKDGFAGDDEEVHFFRDIKPHFTGEIEYYQCLYKALLFEPEREKDFVTKEYFWVMELKKMEKFFEANGDFFEYWRAGRKDRDAEYFLRKNNFSGNAYRKGRPYDADPDAATSHDWLLSAEIAYGKYRKHVLRQLEGLAK